MRCSKCNSVIDSFTGTCSKCSHHNYNTDTSSDRIESGQLDFDGYESSIRNSPSFSGQPATTSNYTSYSGELASRGMRFLGLVLDWFLVGITLGIGWFIWFLFIAKYGKTPAKFILKTRLVKDSGQSAGVWKTLAHYFLPNFIAWFIAPFTFLGFFSLPYIFALVFAILQTLAWVVPLLDSLCIFLPRRKRLVDYLLGTIVVRD